MVGQDCHLFNAPVDQNIEIARPGASVNEIRLAAEKAQLDDFIQSLPEGYHTLIGELGMRFSGGQRQRLLLARAIVRDSPILMLDEPTANLDILTERRVMDTIFALSEGRSLLLMTHRLLGLEQMDEILVLKDGRIAEQGLHEDLVAAGGIYAHMWELQHRASL